MLGMVEIEKHQFLIEGGGKALPFLTGFTKVQALLIQLLYPNKISPLCERNLQISSVELCCNYRVNPDRTKIMPNVKVQVK